MFCVIRIHHIKSTILFILIVILIIQNERIYSQMSSGCRTSMFLDDGLRSFTCYWSIHIVLPTNAIWQISSYAMMLTGLEHFLHSTIAVLLTLKCISA
jgi:hypothetical protein